MEKELVRPKLDVSFLIAQHELYIKRVELAIKNKEPFEHKECGRYGIEKACPFGKKFYTEIIPLLESFPPEVKKLLIQIEELHCEFHQIGQKIDTLNPEPSVFRELKDASLGLYQKLMELDRVLKSLSP